MHAGDRLRSIRRQKGLSLHDVEALSKKEFKASVLGAYERGERAISVPRLLRLAAVYGVPSDQLLPRDSEVDVRDPSAPGTRRQAKYRIDLTRLVGRNEPTAVALARYARAIQVQRQDFNGRLLTIRGDDLLALACVSDMAPDVFASTAEELGLLSEAAV